jgi:hypothetical protein
LPAQEAAFAELDFVVGFAAPAGEVDDIWVSKYRKVVVRIGCIVMRFRG